MATKYRWFFDNVLVSEPVNSLEMQETIQYDDKLKFIYWEKSNSFKFIGSSYDALYAMYVDGFCNEVAVHIDEDCALNGNFAPVFDGIIKIRDVKFNFIECSCTTNVNDNNYFALINNNANLEYLLSAGKSKNNVIIDIPPLIDVLIPNPCPGGFPDQHRDLYYVDDVFAAIVAHITDGRVTYESPYFGTGGEKEFLMCGNGYQGRVEGWFSILPLLGLKIDYETLFSELEKHYNLGIYIDYSGTLPKLIVDKYENLYTASKSITISNPKKLSLLTFVDKLYSGIKMGGETYPEFSCPDDGNFPTEINYYGFKREQFNFTSQCNTKTLLEIEASAIVDTNALFQIIFKGITTYDSNIILLDCYDDSGQITATITDILGDGNEYLNGDLTNYSIAQRFKSILNASFSAFYTQTDYTFDAYDTAITDYTGVITTISQFQFDDDYLLGNDPTNFWGNGTPQGFPVSQVNSKTTGAPVPGVYYFRFTAHKVQRPQFPLVPGNFTVTINRYTSLGVFVAAFSEGAIANYTVDTDVSLNYNLWLDAGDYIEVEVNNPSLFNPQFSVPWRSRFECIQTPYVSGVNEVIIQGDAKTLKIDIDCVLNRSQYATMKTNFKKYIEVVSKTKIFRGYLYASKYDESTGNTQLTLITSNNFIDGRNS